MFKKRMTNNTMKPFIFLFTCVYNDRNHINHLFESIEKQSANNFVYYLYDDGSTKDTYDDIFEILKNKLNKKGVKAYFEKGKTNKGINKATEHCLLVLRDKFKECNHFAWINSDDWLSERYIETMTKYIIKNEGAALFIPNMYDVRDGKIEQSFKNKLFKSKQRYLVNFFYKHSDLIYSHFVVNSQLFFKFNPSALIFDNSIFKELFNDVCILFLFSYFDSKVVLINENLSYFLIREGSVSDGVSRKQHTATYKWLPYFQAYITQINSDYLSRYLKLIRVLFTYVEYKRLIIAKEFKKAKTYYKYNKKLCISLNLDSNFLCPFKRCSLTYKFPQLFYFAKKIRKKL